MLGFFGMGIYGRRNDLRMARLIAGCYGLDMTENSENLECSPMPPAQVFLCVKKL